MRGIACAVIVAFALAGCAGTPVRKPAVCDGKHRRPANLYGSVLPALPIPLPASQGSGRSMVTPGPGLDAQPQSPVLPQAPAPVFPAPDLDGPSNPPTTGATATPIPAPRVSQGIVARSYLPC